METRCQEEGFGFILICLWLLSFVVGVMMELVDGWCGCVGFARVVLSTCIFVGLREHMLIDIDSWLHDGWLIGWLIEWNMFVPAFILTLVYANNIFVLCSLMIATMFISTIHLKVVN